MSIIEIGRGFLFTNTYGDSVYLINATHRLYLCDTGEGKESMREVKQFIKNIGLENKELIIFNSHSDWDHIWGNDAFLDCKIISHDKAWTRMLERAHYDLEVLSKYHQGDIQIVLPTLTFTDKLIFADDDIEFIYAPGHTICSSIVVDRHESVAYVGDLLEEPVPFINYFNIPQFITTLDFIKSQNYHTIITSHSNVVSPHLIDENRDYLQSVMENKVVNFNKDGFELRHTANLKNLLILNYEQIERTKLGHLFNYSNYKKELWKFLSNELELTYLEYWNIRNIDIITLEKCLKLYHSQSI